MLQKNNESQQLKKFLISFKKQIDPVITGILKNSLDKQFSEITSYQVLAGGKRLRPALALLSCLSVGGKQEDVLMASAGLEILHNYTLIIDDIIDHSELRRNKPTTWAKYGKSIAECVSIYYGASVFEAAAISDRKSTRLNSSHIPLSRMPSSA